MHGELAACMRALSRVEAEHSRGPIAQKRDKERPEETNIDLSF